MLCTSSQLFSVQFVADFQASSLQGRAYPKEGTPVRILDFCRILRRIHRRACMTQNFKLNSSLLDQGLPKGGHYSTHKLRVSRVKTRDDVVWVVYCVVVCECVCVFVCSGARTRPVDRGTHTQNKTSKTLGPASPSPRPHPDLPQPPSAACPPSSTASLYFTTPLLLLSAPTLITDYLCPRCAMPARWLSVLFTLSSCIWIIHRHLVLQVLSVHRA